MAAAAKEAQEAKAADDALPTVAEMEAGKRMVFGEYYILEGQPDMAKEAFTTCLTMATALGHKALMAAAHGGLGQVLEIEDDMEGAVAAHTKALGLAKEGGMVSVHALVHDSLGRCKTKTGDLEGARYHHEQDHLLSLQRKDRDGIARACGKLAALLTQLGKADKAAEYQKLHDEAAADVQALKEAEEAEEARKKETGSLDPGIDEALKLITEDSQKVLKKE